MAAPWREKRENADYIKSTCKNYEGRSRSFAEWAEEDSNAKSAAKCRELLLKYLTTESPDFQGRSSVKVLDAGCGSGRDLAAFGKDHLTLLNNSTLPIEAVGFDCAKGFVDECKSRGLNAVEADFIGYWSTVPKDTKYDAVFSLAALFHLPEKELAKTLGLFHEHLYPRGVVLSTIPTGEMDEKMGDGRWMLNLPEEKQKKMFQDAGFNILDTERTKIYNGNRWLVLVAQKN